MDFLSQSHDHKSLGCQVCTHPSQAGPQAVLQRCDGNSVCAGFGPQKLATLAAYALRRNLLDWLETFKVEKLCAERLAKQRERSKVSSE